MSDKFTRLAQGASDLVSRLAGQAPSPRYRKLEDAARELYEREASGWRIAEDLLYRFPESLGKIDQFVGDHGMDLGRPLGSGAESLVWEVHPRSAEGAHVLKVRAGDAEVSDFDTPLGVPGIAPYWATGQAGPRVAAALQPKAQVVYSPKVPEKTFKLAAERLRESLLARGWHWGDGHQYNLGVMPDGTWGAIDGWIHRPHPDMPLPQIPPEEAIRMLRVTPEERLNIYGSE